MIIVQTLAQILCSFFLRFCVWRRERIFQNEKLDPMIYCRWGGWYCGYIHGKKQPNNKFVIYNVCVGGWCIIQASQFSCVMTYSFRKIPSYTLKKTTLTFYLLKNISLLSSFSFLKLILMQNIWASAKLILNLFVFFVFFKQNIYHKVKWKSN